MRRQHDKNRSANRIQTLARGDIVHRFNKTAQPKMQFQWSNPVWLVIKVSSSTCTLKPLVSPQGRMHKPVHLKVTNVKHVRRSAPRPADFWVGVRVRRQFNNNWFLGTVVGVTVDEGETYYQIDYDDCDQEELDAGQLWDSVIYHPRMDDAKGTLPEIPEVGHFIVFALDKKPRLGQVMSINTETIKPISIHLWKPNKHCKSLEQARFRPSTSESGPDLMIIHPSQVRLSAVELTAEGYLSSDSKKRVRNLLRNRKSNKTIIPSTGKSKSKHTITQ